MINRRIIETLVGFHAEGAPAVSCYLNVDGAQYSPHQNTVRARQLTRQALRELPSGHWTGEATISAQTDLDRIARFVESEFERKDWRGLAIFGCAAREFWRICPLAVPVSDNIVVGPEFVVRPLATLLSDYKRFGLAMIDRNNARLFVVEGGECVECVDSNTMHSQYTAHRSPMKGDSKP